ncbi:MAG: mRNA surveillance protein pelota [Candidatus Nanohaloarchaeota archaeon QJJ-7]|nr:mRNA surveillance protein pelota [Candidatus Nanohaloarchaeota archaeon QJJ-7]
MKVLSREEGEGYMELEVESDSDLWHLRHVVDEGDVLRSEDQRTTIEGGEKKYTELELQVEKTSYEGDRLRATGEITEAPEDVEHGYHTFNLEKGITFEIWKRDWKDYQLDRIEKASETDDYEVMVCMIDSEGANFAIITETGIRELSDVESGISGKMYQDDSESEEEFYRQVISVLETYTDVDRIIVSGPGFEKENLVERIEDERLEEQVVLEDASTTGKAGVQEVIKRGAVKRVLEESRISEESEAVESFLDEVNSGGDVTYGKDEVSEAVEMGAVEKLLITEPLVPENENLMEEVEQKNGKVQIVHEDHDAGKKLSSLGSIAAELRYSIE